MSEKLYLNAQQLLEDSFSLAAKVYRSGFRPSFIVAVWRGGAPMGIAMQELLAYRGIHADHITVRTSSYKDIDNQASHVQVFNLNYLVRRISAEDRLLIVDDVYDTGRSVEAVIDTLREKTRRNLPTDIRVAVPYYKPSRNKTGKAPDYFLHETDQWLKFPHSLEGLTHDEVRKFRPELAEILGEHLT
ncbi:phosphoribosyltransferase [Granulosicoccus antarcticus]|uniref:Xanthine phosphoribosyltransferase n=1 Tax=Granulosicoccus antarcticus IMCC3135 TaxID=1192854 RepID=A0A2Z2NK99_9GAMM|nr:phosphoribosyltransferase family protein [Granulosicoccus antarcticus]ASJ71736.1 Xanthine phosphoribosyltransferase [Granulosicoccus antarcticus IMCC3135]